MEEPDVHTIRSWEPATVTLPTGRALRIKIKRLDLGESAEFERLYARAWNRDSDRVLLVRKPGDDLQREVTSAISQADLDTFYASAALLQQSLDRQESDVGAAAVKMLHSLLEAVQPTERYVLSDEEIRRRRLLELSPRDRESYEDLKKKDDQAFDAVALHALTQFVRVVPGQLKWHDEDTDLVSDVRTGAELAKALGAQGGVIWTILLLIRTKNQLTDDEKKDSGSLSNSRTSSIDSDPTVSGGARDPIAASAVN